MPGLPHVDARGVVVSCPSCATPHHEDCWEYLGGCSTFGCASASTVVPELRSRAAGVASAALDERPFLDALHFVEASGPAPVLYFSAGGDCIELAAGESAVQVTPEALDAMDLPLRLTTPPRAERA